MLRSVYSPQDTHVDHLRNLLDQRSTKADNHGRYSPISEYSDTPSVYSRSFFSPRPSYNGEHINDQDFPSPPAVRYHPDQLNDRAASMLDLDDEPRSSLPSENNNIDATGYEDEDKNPTTRMSYLGPIMRFHSRAPWESEDDAVEEETEPDESGRPFQSVFPFRGNGAKSATSSSSSPRPSYATSRPSGESSRSQVPPKRSFETINSQISYPRGTFYTLAQESVSSHSLGRFTPPVQEAFRPKFSLGRLRSEPSTADSSPSSNPSPRRSPLTTRFPPSLRDNDPFATSFERSTTPHTVNRCSVRVEDDVHPYANPDLVVSCIVDQPPHSPFRATSKCQQHASDEANITLSESYTTNSISRSGPRSTLMPDATLTPALPKYRASSIQVKNISSPVPVVGASHRIETPLADNRLEQNLNSVSADISNLPGWTDPNAAPTFSLISLEEARAQRMRSAAANPTSRISMSNPSAAPLPIETEAGPGADISHVGGSTTRTRSRSISAGANKARSALQTIVGQPKPERRGSEPTIVDHQPGGAGHPGRILKHKKSGFMRLFNAGKVPEKDEQTTPPPVPSLPDPHLQSAVQRTPKPSIHRIPVPSLAPSLFESSSSQSSDTSTGDSDINSTWKQSMKRTPPSLSINTQHAVVGIASASDNRQNQAQASPPFTSLDRAWQNDQPQSAPTNVSEFPALKLRPMSTLFSAHFGDHIVATELRPSSGIESTTPRSSSPRGVISPSPVSTTRATHEQSILHDQSSVVRSLQEQLVTANKAWQLHIWELEGQVRDLKATVEELKGSDNKNYCQSCGRGRKDIGVAAPHSGSVVHRPRVRTGTSSRFTNALP